jgi:hypothetical protein
MFSDFVSAGIYHSAPICETSQETGRAKVLRAPWVRATTSVLSASNPFLFNKPIAESTLEAARIQGHFHCVAILDARPETSPRNTRRCGGRAPERSPTVLPFWA